MLGGVDGVEEPAEVVGGEGLGEFSGFLGGEERLGGIVSEAVARDEVAEENLEVDDEDSLGGGGESVFATAGEESRKCIG